MEDEPKIGYRSWQIVNPTNNARLAAMCKAFTWTSKNVMEGQIPDFSNKSGFYSYKEPVEVVHAGLYPKREFPAAMGQIALRGDTVTGSKASRTNAASIKFIYDDEADTEPCSICRKEPSTTYLSIGSSNDVVNVCPSCIRRIKVALGSKTKLAERSRQDVLHYLSDYYNVPLKEMSSDLKRALKESRSRGG